MSDGSGGATTGDRRGRQRQGDRLRAARPGDAAAGGEGGGEDSAMTAGELGVREMNTEPGAFPRE